MIETKISSAPATTGSSAERTLRLLAHLAEEGRPISLAELAADLSLPKGTAHRLCMQLLDSGFIARDINERDYVVGPTLRKLSLDTLNHGALLGLRHQVLSELVAQIGETCSITTLDGASVLLLDCVEALWPWRLTLAIGEHVPLHCTASGKLLLAMGPTNQRNLLISQLTLTAMTDTTITSPSALLIECEKIVAAGYALNQQEFVDGLLAIAVPVVNDDGVIRAALAVYAPVSRMPAAVALDQLPALQAAATRLTSLL